MFLRALLQYQNGNRHFAAKEKKDVGDGNRETFQSYPADYHSSFALSEDSGNIERKKTGSAYILLY